MVTTYDFSQDEVDFEFDGFEISIATDSDNITENTSGTYGFGWRLTIPDSDPDSTVEMTKGNTTWQFTNVQTIEGVVRAEDRTEV